MVDFGTVESVTVDKFFKSSDQYVIVDVLLTNSDDLFPCVWVPGSGRQGYPWKGDAVLVIYVSQKWGVAIPATDHIAIDVAQGEQKIYSYNSNREVQAYLKLFVDGVAQLNGKSTVKIDSVNANIELQGNTKNFVTGDELQGIINTIWTGLTTAISAGLGATAPGANPAAVTAFETATGAISTDITSAKTTRVVTGG